MYIGRSCLTPGARSQKTSFELNTEFPIKTVFLGVRGFTASFCVVYDYMISGYMDLERTYVMYIQYTYISIQCIYF